MADSREVMNIRQASQYLGVSPDTLYKYVNEQKIPAFKLGNRWKFKRSMLDAWTSGWKSSPVRWKHEKERKLRLQRSLGPKGGQTCLDLHRSQSLAWT